MLHPTHMPLVMLQKGKSKNCTYTCRESQELITNRCLSKKTFNISPTWQFTAVFYRKCDPSGLHILWWPGHNNNCILFPGVYQWSWWCACSATNPADDLLAKQYRHSKLLAGPSTTSIATTKKLKSCQPEKTLRICDHTWGTWWLGGVTFQFIFG
jgi:hypothetical protein